MARKSFKLVKNVHVNDILLDVDNARIRTGTDQKDCIQKILRKEDQLVTLAQDIFASGLTTMPILVKPKGKKWVVKDGNRRIAALKILNDPDRWISDARVKARFTAIRDLDPEEVLSKVDVLASSDDDAIMAEVLARHSGAQEGAGQLDWSAYLRNVYLSNNHLDAEYKRPVQYVFWAEKHGTAVPDEFPITALQRFFSIGNLARLGFVIDDKDELKPTLPLDKVKGMANLLITDFAHERKKTEDVFTVTKATEYIDQLRAMNGVIDAPPPPTAAPSPSSSQSGGSSPPPGGTTTASPPAAGSVGSQQSQADPPPPPARAPSTPKTAPADRNRIFGRVPGIVVPASETKATTIVTELRKLDLNETPLAAAALLRTLLEISDEYYREQQRVQNKGGLAKNIAASADSMLNRGALNRSEHDMVTRMVSGPPSMMPVETLQKMMHRKTHHVSKSFVNTLWDNIGCFVKACWR